MENKRKVVPTWVSVILLLLCIAGIAYYGYTVTMILPYIGWTSFTVAYITGIISSILALIYCLTGYKKSSAGIFKAYCISITISYMITTYSAAQGTASNDVRSAVMFFSTMTQCGLWFVLTIARDLGRKKSLTICGILALLQLIAVIINIPYGVYVAAIPAVGFVNYIITYIMFYAKYQDKEARGTK